MSAKKTVVLGASANPARYSNLAIQRLRAKGYPVIAIGKREGNVGDVNIVTEPKQLQDIDTVTIYLNPENQRQYYQYILSLQPKRIIFNPGAENTELEEMATTAGINVQDACTLVMLSTGQF